MPKSFSLVRYVGYGPYESYCDKHRASWFGTFHTDARQSFEPYLRPQENGTHWNCTEAAVFGAVTMLQIHPSAPISVNFSDYTQEELTRAAHLHELIACESNVLCLDFAHSGVGSNSCGPKLAPEYQVSQETFSHTLQFEIGISR
jgi:beta-galactosidase